VFTFYLKRLKTSESKREFYHPYKINKTYKIFEICYVQIKIPD